MFMHLRQLRSDFRLLFLLWLLAAAVLLGSAPEALAQPATWTGPFAIKLSKEQVSDTTHKLAKTSGSDTGKVEFYLGPDGPTQDGDGYYMRFISDADGLVVAITDLNLMKSDVPGSKTDTLFGMGTGIHFGNGTQGPAYIDVSKGTVVKDGSGNITSISMTAKSAGGVTHGNGADYVWHGSTKFTLTPAPE